MDAADFKKMEQETGFPSDFPRPGQLHFFPDRTE